MSKIVLTRVRVHNLQSVDLSLDANQLVVFTGVSGSGKSSLAFDTLYAEGQRRYVESLSTFARRQIGDMQRPDIEHAEGITPTISIEQATAGRNPRSTVGTMTEIYDYLRVLFARIAIPHCPVSGEPVKPQSRERIIRTVQSLEPGTQVMLLAPYARAKKAEFKDDFEDLTRKGFTRVRVDGAIRRLGEDFFLDGSLAHDVDIVIDRITVDAGNQSRLAEAITQALELGQGTCHVVNVDTEEEQLFSLHAFSPKSGLSYAALEPHDFSFNSPSGMCLRCNGLGTVNEFNIDLVIDPTKSIAEDCCRVASSYHTVRYGNIYRNLADLYGFDVNTPWSRLSESAKRIFLFGIDKKYVKMRFVHPETGASWIDFVAWRGVLSEAYTRFREAKSDGYRSKMLKLMCVQSCPECHGSRLKPYPTAARLHGQRLSDLSAMTIADCLAFLNRLTLDGTEARIADELLKEIRQRLTFLLDVGLHYLTLNRTAPTLSGGESQRVRLASQIGCGLVGITYILDEPSIGLHPRDNKKLIDTLKHLRNKGNTVVVVEHDEETMAEADHLVDFGPGAGSKGGKITCSGSLQALIKTKQSLTADYLSGRKEIAIPTKRRSLVKDHSLTIIGACHHNLKNITVDIPLGIFVAVTGVSGSGKSSLITDTLFPALSNALHHGDQPVGANKKISGIEKIDKVIAIDQSPIGRNPRSNPATYIKLFDDIRDLFSQLPESRARGYLPGRFSFNVKEGTCPHCLGMGMVKIDMDFLEPAWVECPQCHGRRFDHETLSIHFKDKNIYDILEMDVAEALDFFQAIPAIHHKLAMLQQVGMEYIKLGQSSTTLSGGEAQRIKLAKELVRPSTGKTLYILDEPTTGLHFHDINHLLTVLQRLVDRGNTVLVIEHNMDVVKSADWVIDLGYEGGEGGGQVVALGTPEQVADQRTPTGDALQIHLQTTTKQRMEAALKTRTRQRRRKPLKQEIPSIMVRGAEQNNLRCLDVNIPRHQLTVCTGPSGSGKSSLAFETIYAEGQRRYIESLSPYARQFVKQMPKPKVGQVDGLSPAIAIEQKSHAGNPRSTVGTMTEVYDYLRVLFARLGIAHCPDTGEVIRAISKDHVVDRILSYPPGEKLLILAGLDLRKADSFQEIVNRFRRRGFQRIRLNGTLYELDQQESIPFDRRRKNALFLVVDRIKVEPSARSRLAEAIDNATEIGGGALTVARPSGDVFFNLTFAVESTGKSYPEITPHTFGFNTAEGMCQDCQGLGFQYGADLSSNTSFTQMTVFGILTLLCGDKLTGSASQVLKTLLAGEGIGFSQQISSLTTVQRQFFMNGAPEENWSTGKTGIRLRWLGINPVLAKIARSGRPDFREAIIPLLDEQECHTCGGTRINALARHVTIAGKSIADICRQPLQQALEFMTTINIDPAEGKLLDEVKRQLISRLTFLNDVGLSYLSLDRRAPTLSGGEAQRIRLSRQLGSGLTGVLYVLDEPTIGLHPRDNARLNDALAQLRALGNTMLMVEHDPLTVATADYLLDFGPGAGRHGGHIVAQGTLKQMLRDPRSPTGAYLSGRKCVPVPKQRRLHDQGQLQITHASKHNLKDVSVTLPLGLMTCITGVSGSGKSTLMQEILLPAVERGLHRKDLVSIDHAIVSGIAQIDKVIAIDQDPIGRTARSDVVTYVEVMGALRDIFAALPAARAKGLQPKHFSYNHRRGMCSACWGLGYKQVEMHFLPPVRITCSECQGMRLNPVSLGIHYQGKNLGQYLQLTVEEVRAVFEHHPRVRRILDTLISVGLGYLTLGQEMVSLSGGEAQRMKLSRELARRSMGHTLYLLDEPTTGLHSDDIVKLLMVLHRLVDKGHSVFIIEHNMDVILNADYVIDLGPDAGAAGGRIVCCGTPEEIAQHPTSWTGKYLREKIS